MWNDGSRWRVCAPIWHKYHILPSSSRSLCMHTPLEWMPCRRREVGGYAGCQGDLLGTTHSERHSMRQSSMHTPLVCTSHCVHCVYCFLLSQRTSPWHTHSVTAGTTGRRLRDTGKTARRDGPAGIGASAAFLLHMQAIEDGC